MLLPTVICIVCFLLNFSWRCESLLSVLSTEARSLLKTKSQGQLQKTVIDKYCITKSPSHHTYGAVASSLMEENDADHTCLVWPSQQRHPVLIRQSAQAFHFTYASLWMRERRQGSVVPHGPLRYMSAHPNSQNSLSESDRS